jgi:hypothetical protein
VSQHKRNTLLDAQVGQPVPGKPTFHGHHEILAIRSYGLEKGFRGGWHIPVEHDLTVSVEDTDIHRLSLKICDRTLTYGDPEMLGELEAEDARTVTLDSLVRGEQLTFLYEYDFGDSWEHELRIETTLPREGGKRYPVCLTGKRACPPEDY